MNGRSATIAATGGAPSGGEKSQARGRRRRKGICVFEP